MLSNTSIDELINKRLAKIISKSAKRVMSPKSTTNIATSTINSNSNSNQNIDSITPAGKGTKKTLFKFEIFNFLKNI